MILVTGATGFVGGAVIARLEHEQRPAVAAVRSEAAMANWRSPCPAVRVGDLSSSTDWSRALEGVDAVIHCAARVHVLRESAADPLAEHRRVNVEGTLQLAKQAVAAKVRRLVFVSSIK